MKVERRSRWILSLRGGEAVDRRIFCFPFAGGGTSSYRRWAASVRDGIELCAIQLPGHEDRLSEPSRSRLSDLIPELIEQLAPYLDRPFALFGHSMGALIAFELARTLGASGAPAPIHLFVSGRRAPHLAAKRRPLHTLAPMAFESELRRLQGTPTAVLDDRETMDLLTPVLRTDFAICETYVFDGGAVDVPISVFGGADDPEATREELEAWRACTRAACEVHLFPGNHFFLHDQADALARRVQDTLIASRRAP
jgi:medium-chain acyl-[acyl-carrier-protein] hydrolase